MAYKYGYLGALISHERLRNDWSMEGHCKGIRLCLTVCGAASMLASWYFIAGHSAEVRAVYEHE